MPTGGGGATLGDVTLSSSAFDDPPAAGEIVRLDAVVSGGTAPFTYEWDLDGDGAVDRSGSAPHVEASFPNSGTVQVVLRVSDASGSSVTQNRGLRVRGPRVLTETIGVPTQVCGNDDTQIDPGETWRQTIRVTNVGDAPIGAGHALFAPVVSTPIGVGRSRSGYSAFTSADGFCGLDWIDLVEGGHATPALATVAASGSPRGDLNDARSAVIDLGERGFFFDRTLFRQAVMSTNGYLSFDPAEQGGDFSAGCSDEVDSVPVALRLLPYHDDLRVPGSGSTPSEGAGLRYRYFEDCPRRRLVLGVRDACHVFSWTRMQRDNYNQPDGDFDFQAVAYANGSIVYQYRNASPDQGAAATIGFLREGDVFNFSCQGSRPVPANSAVCLSVTAYPRKLSEAQLVTPVPAMPALASGQAGQVSVDFTSERTASCGSSLAFDFIAAADANSHWFEPKRVFDGAIAANCQSVAPACMNFTPVIPPPSETKRNGTYFNTQRAGNGLIRYFDPLSDHGALVFAAWFTALKDRTPTWYALSGQIDDRSGRLPISYLRNFDAPSGFAVGHQNAGDAWIAQIDDDSLLLAWQLSDGKRGVERMDSLGLPAGRPNHTQTWYDYGEPGWGLSIETLATPTPFEFVGAFIYDARGVPRWATGSFATYTGGDMELTAQRPHCPGCPWIVDWAVEGRGAGSLHIEYEDSSPYHPGAITNTSITLPPPFSGVWNRSNIVLQPSGLIDR